MKQKKPLIPLLDLLIIFSITIYILLDTLVIPHAYATVQAESTAEATTETVAAKTEAVSTDTTYSNGSVSITLSTYRVDDTNVYVADVTLSDVSELQTALAQNTYGRNITATTSTTASSVNAVLAINGDFYGARSSGYVIRNGTLYRSTAASSDQEDLAIQADGSFLTFTEGSMTADELESSGVLQVFSFGPTLIENGEISVDTNDEVDQAMTTNPRTAICEISPLHYLLVVADGRTSASTGLTLYQMAQFLQSLGVTSAYNLDGGGSSTMVFQGNVVNQPTTNGKTIKERSVSDIIYIAY